MFILFSIFIPTLAFLYRFFYLFIFLECSKRYLAQKCFFISEICYNKMFAFVSCDVVCASCYKRKTWGLISQVWGIVGVVEEVRTSIGNKTLRSRAIGYICWESDIKQRPNKN